VPREIRNGQNKQGPEAENLLKSIKGMKRKVKERPTNDSQSEESGPWDHQLIGYATQLQDAMAIEL